MKILVTSAALLGLMFAANMAHAQSAISGSQSGSSSSTTALQGNQQQAASAANVTIDQSGSSHTTVRDVTTPPVSIAGFGTSFSPDSCVNTTGGGVSVMGAGASYAKGIRDDACSKIRQFYAWGQESAYDRKIGDRDAEAIAKSMRIYLLCMADSDSQRACLKLGAIVVGKKD